MNQTNPDDEKKALYKMNLGVLGIVLLVFCFWVGSYFLVPRLAKTDNPQISAGEVGDMFGAVNALFSGLAFVGLIYTILLQSQELRLQREELALTRQEMVHTREEIEGQKRALEAQLETMQLQQFEESFYQLIRFLKENLGELRVIPEKTNNVANGAGGIFGAKSNYQEQVVAYTPSAYNQSILFIKQSYANELVFITTIGLIFDLFDRYTSLKTDSYTKILFYQFNKSELILIYFMGLGSSELKSQIEKYTFFEKSRFRETFERYFDQTEDFGFYAPSAFVKVSPELRPA